MEHLTESSQKENELEKAGVEKVELENAQAMEPGLEYRVSPADMWAIEKL